MSDAAPQQAGPIDAAPQQPKPAGGGLTENKALTDLSQQLSPGYDEHLFGCLSDTTGCVLSFCLPCMVAGATKVSALFSARA